MGNKILKIAAVLIGLSFILTGLSQAAAAVVWSDDFDDGNYNGWTVAQGAFSVTDFALRSESTGDSYNTISHPSTTTVGTWNFSYYHDAGTDSQFLILFMANGTTNPFLLDGYGIEIVGSLDIPSIRLLTEEKDLGQVYLDILVPAEDFQGTWTNFAVSRNSTGGLNVWINGSHTFEVVNNDFDYSETFVFSSYSSSVGVEGGRLDNIIVSDQPLSPPTTSEPAETTTPSETPTGPGTPDPINPMLLAIAGAGVVIVIVAIVCMKRK